MKELTLNEKNVLYWISLAGKLQMTREILCRYTGLCDRANRRIISKLRHKDYWIISSPQKAGYYLTDNPKEWDIFVDNWNQSNRYNMLKKSTWNEKQEELEWVI